MIEHRHDDTAANAAASQPDNLSSRLSDGRLAETDAMYPVGFGQPDTGSDGDPVNIEPDTSGAAARWAAAQSELLYRFVVQSPSAPAVAATDFDASFPVGGTTSNAALGDPGMTDGTAAAGAGSLAAGETRSGGGGGSSTISSTLAVSSVQVGGAGGLVFNISFDSSATSAPAGFIAAVENAAQLYASTFSNPVTINLDVGWGEIGGQRLSPGALGESETYLDNYSYSQVRSALIADATSADQEAADTTLPTTSPVGSSSFSVATAEAKALGITGASSSLDGYVGFGSSSYTFDPNNRAVSGEYDFIGVAEHEISEVMGRDAYLGEAGLGYSALDLFRYSSAGTRQLVGGSAADFSIDGGNANLNNFNTNSSGDYGDWASSAGNDSYDAFSNSGVANLVSATDIREMNVLGYTLAGSSSPSTPATPSTPAAPTTPTTPPSPHPNTAPPVAVFDTTTGQSMPAVGTSYSGPVSRLQYQYVYTGGNSVNVSVSSDNWFLKGGPGNDAIQAYGGYNVIDGGSGSNFLTGGNGTDTFFVDDRNASSDIWSTVNDFHAGDDATLFGITSADTIQWFNNQGAAGFAGLTVHVSAPGQATASLTLPGYSSSDLGNGRLAVQFGSESDGTPYMHIIASG